MRGILFDICFVTLTDSDSHAIVIPISDAAIRPLEPLLPKACPIQNPKSKTVSLGFGRGTEAEPLTEGIRGALR